MPTITTDKVQANGLTAEVNAMIATAGRFDEQSANHDKDDLTNRIDDYLILREGFVDAYGKWATARKRAKSDATPSSYVKHVKALAKVGDERASRITTPSDKIAFAIGEFKAHNDRTLAGYLGIATVEQEGRPTLSLGWSGYRRYLVWLAKGYVTESGQLTAAGKAAFAQAATDTKRKAERSFAERDFLSDADGSSTADKLVDLLKRAHDLDRAIAKELANLNKATRDQVRADFEAALASLIAD